MKQRLGAPPQTTRAMAFSRRKRVAAWAASGVLAWAALVLVRPAVGQEPAKTDTDGGTPPTASAAMPGDAAAPPVSVSPSAPPAPATPDAGAPDATAPPNMTAALATGATINMARFRHANTWDLNLEGGGGYVFGDIDKWTGFVRARPGVLFVRNDEFYQVGPTVEYLGMLKRPAFGAQVEYLHLQLGTWIQLGGSIDTKGRPGANAAVGLSIFGVEAQVREFDNSTDPAFALIGKIRIPLGILVYGLSTKK